MSARRLDRINELLKREIADLCARIVLEDGFDPAASTITRVSVSSDLRHASVFASVRGDAAAQRRALRLLQHHHGEFQRHIAADLKLKYTPQLLFRLDESLQLGDRVLDILAHLPEQPDPTTPQENSTDDADVH